MTAARDYGVPVRAGCPHWPSGWARFDGICALLFLAVMHLSRSLLIPPLHHARGDLCNRNRRQRR